MPCQERLKAGRKRQQVGHGPCRPRASCVETTQEAVVNKTSGKQFRTEPMPKSRQVIIDAGGLIPYTRQRLQQQPVA